MPETASDKMRYAHGLNIPKASHKAVRKLKKELPEAEIHGHKIWGSSYLLMDYFNKKKNRPGKGADVLEVGCGWGLASIYFAKKHKAQVTALDADKGVFPYLDLIAQLNDTSVETKKKRFEAIRKKDLRAYDIVVGADICFWDELTGTLYKLVKRAMEAGVSKVVIADPGRQPFHDLHERLDKKYNAQCLEWSTDAPKRATGYLLVVEPN